MKARNSHLRHIVPQVLTVLLIAQGMASAMQCVTAREYVTLRKKLAAVSVNTASSSPATYVGKYVEIRGRVAGLSKSSSGGAFIVCTQDEESYLVDADRLPVENPGPELACLVRVGEGCTHSLSQLTLVYFTYNAELTRLEDAWNRAAAGKQQKQGQDHEQPTSKVKQATAKFYSAEELACAYKEAVKRFNPKLSESLADAIARSILGFSYHYGVDPRLVCAVILAESRFRVTATSPKGAIGLGQLMPTTAAGLGVNNAYDPVQNIYGSVRYIRSMLDRICGRKKWNELSWGELALALAAYNAGPGAVKKHGGIPPYRETQSYVRRVVSIYKQLCGVKG